MYMYSMCMYVHNCTNAHNITTHVHESCAIHGRMRPAVSYSLEHKCVGTEMEKKTSWLSCADGLRVFNIGVAPPPRFSCIRKNLLLGLALSAVMNNTLRPAPSTWQTTFHMIGKSWSAVTSTVPKWAYENSNLKKFPSQSKQ